MTSLKQYINSIISDSVHNLYREAELTVNVEYCDIKFGHFSTNFALANAKILKQKPLDIANKITTKLAKVDEFKSVNVVEPGFVNITLENTVLQKFIDEVGKDTSAYIGKPGRGKKMVIDYSHPNIGKPMGVHHLLSTVIGDSIKLLHRQMGYEVIADNFIGDLGTQFGKLIHAVKTWGNIEEIEKNPVPELQKLYVKFHIQADSDEKLDDAGRLEYKKLEEGDPENRELLKKIQDWSKADMQQIYNALNIQFDYMHGESFYEDKLRDIIQLGVEKKIFKESQGALVYESNNPEEPPALVRKKDGTSLYLTRDLARIKYWNETWHPNIMVVVVDLAQSFQIKQLFEVAKALSLTEAQNIHVGFGRMSFKDGSMSTRKGNIILISDLITETRKRVQKNIEDNDSSLTTEEKSELCNKLTVNCLKYNILRQNRLSNITFDWNTMLSLEGNSAPYLAYTIARMNSIQQTCTDNSIGQETNQRELEGDEIELALHISMATQVFNQALGEFEPSNIADFCYQLAHIYNRFYHKYKIIEDNQINQLRLILNNTSLEIMKLCFSVLGLSLIEKM